MKTISSTLFCLYVLLFAGDLFASSAIDQPPIVIDSLKIYQLEPHFYVLEDSTMQLTFQDVRTEKFDSLFHPIDNIKAWKSDGIYWGRLVIENNLIASVQKSNWVFFPYAMSSTSLEVYYFDDIEQQYIKKLVGMFVPTAARQGINMYAFMNDNGIPINIPVGQALTLYVRVENEMQNSSPNFLAELNYPTINDINYTSQFFFSRGTSFGAILIMFLYIGILSIILRDKAYWYYALYLLTLAIYIAYTLLILPDWLFNNYLIHTSPKFRYFLRLTGFLLVIFYLYFMRTYTESKSTLPKWDKCFKWLIRVGYVLIVISGISLLVTNFNPTHCNYIFIAYFLPVTISSLAFLYPLYQLKIAANNFIILGILVMLIGGFSMFPILAGGDIDTYIGNFLLVVVVEIIIFTVGLSYRQKEKEKQSKLAEVHQIEAQNLKELNIAKNRLYTNITHNFRSPLTVIKGLTKQLDAPSETVATIDRNCNEILESINQILKLSKLDAKQVSVHFINADIIAYLRYLLEGFQSYAASKKIKLHFSSQIPSLSMDFDPKVTRDILQNLVGNAIKFTPANGDVYLMAEQVKNNLQLVVKDTGIGISKNTLPHIFDRYYQANDITQIEQGTGIGLAVVKELVLLLEGTIHAKSEIDQGTSFQLTIPIRNDYPTTNLPTNGIPKHTKPEKSIILNNHQPVVLIIEDSKDIILYLKKMLPSSYQVITAEEGKKGVQLAFQYTPDIIICDIGLPILNGYQICQQLKYDTRTSHIPIILLTGDTNESSKIKGFSYGADAYLTKPFNEQELLVRMEQFLHSSKKLQAQLQQLESVPSTVSTSNGDIQFLQKTQQIIETNLANESFSVPQLARKLGINRSTLYKKIKAYTGKSVAEYIKYIRLQKANELLQQTELPISQIAYQVGFKDHPYFSKCFAKEFGISPKETRN